MVKKVKKIVEEVKTIKKPSGKTNHLILILSVFGAVTLGGIMYAITPLIIPPKYDDSMILNRMEILNKRQDVIENRLDDVNNRLKTLENTKTQSSVHKIKPKPTPVTRYIPIISEDENDANQDYYVDIKPEDITVIDTKNVCEE